MCKYKIRIQLQIVKCYKTKIYFSINNCKAFFNTKQMHDESNRCNGKIFSLSFY